MGWGPSHDAHVKSVLRGLLPRVCAEKSKSNDSLEFRQLTRTFLFPDAPCCLQQHCTTPTRSPPPLIHITMSSPRALTALARSRPTQNLLYTAVGRTAAFSTVPRRQKPQLGGSAEGPPPDGFRIPTPRRWNETKESIWDQAGKYFLLTEMARGMYVLLEQFFRPP